MLYALQPSCALLEAFSHFQARVNSSHSHLQGWSPLHLCGGWTQARRGLARGSACFEAPEQAGHTWKNQMTSHTHTHSHTQPHTFTPMCTHLQSLGFSLSLCSALPEPGAGWADGSPSNNNKVMEYYYILGCIMLVSNNSTSYRQVTSSTIFFKTKKKSLSLPSSFCWLTLESGRVCGNIPNTGGSESGLLQPADKHHTPPSHSAAPHLSTAYKRKVNDEIHTRLSEKRDQRSASPGFWVCLLELWQRRETQKRVWRRRRRLRGNYWCLRLSAARWQVEAAKHYEQNYLVAGLNIQYHFPSTCICLLLEVFLFSPCCHDTSHTAKDH